MSYSVTAVNAGPGRDERDSWQLIEVTVTAHERQLDDRDLSVAANRLLRNTVHGVDDAPNITFSDPSATEGLQWLPTVFRNILIRRGISTNEELFALSDKELRGRGLGVRAITLIREGRARHRAATSKDPSVDAASP